MKPETYSATVVSSAKLHGISFKKAAILILIAVCTAAPAALKLQVTQGADLQGTCGSGYLSGYSDSRTSWTVRGSNPGGARFSANLQTGPGAHPASCTMDTGSFSRR
jgi:hypothetical protein